MKYGAKLVDWKMKRIRRKEVKWNQSCTSTLGRAVEAAMRGAGNIKETVTNSSQEATCLSIF